MAKCRCRLCWERVGSRQCRVMVQGPAPSAAGVRWASENAGKKEAHAWASVVTLSVQGHGARARPKREVCPHTGIGGK